jgi:hypothetical protein
MESGNKNDWLTDDCVGSQWRTERERLVTTVVTGTRGGASHKVAETVDPDYVTARKKVVCSGVADGYYPVDLD